jgi:transcriptional regulator GlxA family with amidase domain
VLPAKIQQNRQIVARVEDTVRVHIGDPMRISDLCRTVAVSQRALRNAFHAIHGTTPYRYLRALRMREARKALLQPDTGGATVTRVAMQFGFFELGRFAVEYRLTFGESPSVTLRRSSAARRDLAWAEPASVPLQYSAANVIRFIPRRDSGRRHDVMNAQT